jgi:calmodulin
MTKAKDCDCPSNRNTGNTLLLSLLSIAATREETVWQLGLMPLIQCSFHVVMAHELSPEQMGVLKDVFALFDKDGDGNISPDELNGMLEMLGQHVTREEIAAMFQEADIDANGVIDISDFAALYALRVNSAEESEKDLVETFKFYDINNTGYITASNLMHAMEKLGCRMTSMEAEEMLREADLDCDGRLDYRDFRRMMMAPNDDSDRRRKSRHR